MKLEEPPVVETAAGDLSHRRLLTAQERQGVVLCANSLLLLQDAGGWGRNSEKGGAGRKKRAIGKMTPLEKRDTVEILI